MFWLRICLKTNFISFVSIKSFFRESKPYQFCSQFISCDMSLWIMRKREKTCKSLSAVRSIASTTSASLRPHNHLNSCGMLWVQKILHRFCNFQTAEHYVRSTAQKFFFSGDVKPIIHVYYHGSFLVGYSWPLPHFKTFWRQLAVWKWL